MNRQGQSILQPLFIIIFLLGSAVTAFVVILALGSLGGALQETDLNDDPDQAMMITTIKNLGTNYAGGMFVFMFFGLALGLIITSFLIPEHPIFIIAYIIMLFLCIGIAAIIGNVWSSIIEYDALATIAEEQTLITLIMSNIVPITIGLFVLTMLIVFARPFASAQGGGRI